MEKVTEHAKRRLDALFEAMEIAAEGADVYFTDMKYDFGRWSERAVDIYNLPSNYMYNAGSIWEEHVHPEDRESYLQSIEDIFTGKTKGHDMQYRACDAKGKYYMCTCRGTIINGDDGAPRYFCGVIRNHDIDRNMDKLTGLRNQEGFMEDMQLYINRRLPFRVAIIGIQKFSRLNDLFGYDFGNRILQRCARFVLEHSANFGSIYRLDGARLGLISREIDMPIIQKNYKLMQDRATQSFEIEGRVIDMMINAGAMEVNSFDVNADTIASCLNYAYSESKNNYDGELYIFENKVTQDNQNKLDLLNEIRSSVPHGCEGFELFYQPIMSAETEELKGAEALIRYRKEDGSIVPPVAFIDVLERDALYLTLGSWIMEQAMTDGVKILETYPDFTMNVNLSYIQIKDLSFIEKVQELLDKTGFPADHLCLELTERCRIMNIERLTNLVVKLRALGIRIALDDFGTGFSSLNLLRRLSVDAIKVDRQFILHLLDNKDDQLLIQLLADYAKIYKLDTCIEGVEDRETINLLQSYGVTKLQGYYFSKPIPFAEFESKYKA